VHAWPQTERRAAGAALSASVSTHMVACCGEACSARQRQDVGCPCDASSAVCACDADSVAACCFSGLVRLWQTSGLSRFCCGSCCVVHRGEPSATPALAWTIVASNWQPW